MIELSKFFASIAALIGAVSFAWVVLSASPVTVNHFRHGLACIPPRDSGSYHVGSTGR